MDNSPRSLKTTGVGGPALFLYVPGDLAFFSVIVVNPSSSFYLFFFFYLSLLSHAPLLRTA
jgi:hypothetical protein